MIKIRIGYELLYDFPQPTPLIMVLGTHFSRASDIVVPDGLTTTPCVTITPYRDAFGTGVVVLWRQRGGCACTERRGSRFGLPDLVAVSAPRTRWRTCPDTIAFLLGSRYCETDRLSDIAWKLFAGTPPGWAASRPSATTFMAASPSATSTLGRRRRRGRRSTKAPAFAVTMPTLRSPSAVA